MNPRPFEELDDATFDTSRFRIMNGSFVAEGYVEEPASRFSLRKSVRRPVRLTINDATAFEVEDGAGIGKLILESVDITPGEVTLIGVIPCVVRVRTKTESSVNFLVADDPIQPK